MPSVAQTYITDADVSFEVDYETYIPQIKMLSIPVFSGADLEASKALIVSSFSQPFSAAKDAVTIKILARLIRELGESVEHAERNGKKPLRRKWEYAPVELFLRDPPLWPYQRMYFSSRRDFGGVPVAWADAG